MNSLDNRILAELRDCGFTNEASRRMLRLHSNLITDGELAYKITEQIINAERKRLNIKEDFPEEDLQQCQM